jgi:uncharacterized protein YdbL (DUF1318 family)
MRLNGSALALTALVLAGCVTINIYFPEAAAQQAADRIIDEVKSGAAPAPPVSDRVRPGAAARAVLYALLDLIVPAAQAAADFDASSPAKRALEASLKARFARLKPHLDSGAVGLTADGLLDIRDRNLIPLAERNAVRQLVGEQNADSEALYQEIARINGHPEWLTEIRTVFAERWVAKADPGWYYRDAGGTWRQK